MTKFTYSLMLALLVSSCLATPIDFGKLKIAPNGIAYDPVTKKPFTGRSAQYDGQERLTAIYSFVNGKMEGPYTRWWPTGKEHEAGTLKDGYNWGRLTLRSPNGTKTRESYFGNYMLLNRFKLWHPSGAKMVDWDRDDLECRFWSLDGKLLRHDKIDLDFDENTKKINFAYKILKTDIVLFTPKDVTDVYVTLNESTYLYSIILKVTPEAQKHVRRITAGHIGQMVAIYEGADFMSPAPIREPIDTEVFLFAANLLARDAEPIMQALEKTLKK